MGTAEHLEILTKGVQAWNESMAEDSFIPRLTGEDIYETFRQSNLLTGARKMIPLAGMNFSGANLANTNLSYADLTEADLTNADLTEADLTNANLTGANLTYTKVHGADFRGARYARADFSGTEAWEANFHKSIDRSVENRLIGDQTIKSVADLLRVIQTLTEKKGSESNTTRRGRQREGLNIRSTLYFRGERSYGHDLVPSLMRPKNERIRKHEGDMLRDMMSRRPQDFSESTTALSQWVLAQHHSLNTRFLDISKNPLASLFFACQGGNEKKDEKDGCLRIFDVPNRLIKQFNSDTISVIANFAKLNSWDQDRILGEKCKIDITERPDGYKEAMYYLYQSIQQEKPYFDERINLGDLYRVFVVEPQLSTERVRAQSGAFLVSAYQKRFEPEEIIGRGKDLWVYAHYKLRIPLEFKSDIRRELTLMNITKETLLPGLDSTATAIMEMY